MKAKKGFEGGFGGEGFGGVIEGEEGGFGGGGGGGSEEGVGFGGVA